MTTEAIAACKTFLEGQYRNLFGDSFKGFGPNVHKIDEFPTWIDLPAPSSSSPESAYFTNGAILRDPEVGICAYLLNFESDTAIQKQISRALLIRTKLLPQSNYVSDSPDLSLYDSLGSWRVVLHWLVDDKDYENWLSQVVQIRRDTSYFEEVAIDGIKKDKNWGATVGKYNFPWLLLRTREILRKNEISKIDQWKTADVLVEKEITKFASKFRDEKLIKLANQVVVKSQQFVPTNESPKAVSAPAKPLNTIEIKNLRNIDNVYFNCAHNAHKTTVIHGPNGTGKSSIFEALSIGLFGTSSRYQKFLDDSDSKTTQGYEDYLKPIKNPNMRPKITINGDAKPFQLPDITSSRANLQHLSGTLLPQDRSQELVFMTSDSLAAVILQGYSDLANYLEEYVELELSTANDVRKQFFRDYGLNAAIQRHEKAYERIIEQILTKGLPNTPFTLITWLKDLGQDRLLNDWNSWADRKPLIAAAVKDVNQKNGALVNILGRHLLGYNELTEKAFSISSSYAEIRSKADEIVEQLDVWYNWYRVKDEAKTSLVEDKKSAELKELEESQQNILHSGKMLKARLDHLTESHLFVTKHWHQPEVCPTCDSDVAARNGILAIIVDLEAELNVERTSQLEKYQLTSQRLKTLQSELRIVENPLSLDLQKALGELLLPITGSNALEETYFANEEIYFKLKEQVRVIQRQMPMPTAISDHDKLAERLSDTIARECDRVVEILELPKQWEDIKLQLDGLLDDIMQNHLPRTLGSLWDELTLNLTPANWLLPANPQFMLRQSKGKNKIRQLHINAGTQESPRIARYVYNEAETHIMGLAWFFVRYLTYGRFHYSFIGMDDPAHEMDQITFRGLCRLLETLLRVHEYNHKPLSMLITLNQEDRALDAARATSGNFCVLGWGEKYQNNETISQTTLLGEKFFPRLPTNEVLRIADVNPNSGI